MKLGDTRCGAGNVSFLDTGPDFRFEGTEELHAAAIVDSRTGELWQVPRDTYPWIAWSYGDIALVDTDPGPFLACDAAHRTCERLHPDRPFLMPTN